MSSLEILKSVLEQESKAIGQSAMRLTHSCAEDLSELFRQLHASGGQLVFSGVGKSGVIGQKLSSTFCSLGLPSFFLHPVDALHGDLGRVRPQDALVFLSKSGTTEELLQLIPHLQQERAQCVGLLGNVASPLGEKCGPIFDCSVEKEACLNNQAPTTSTTVTLAVGDAMAVLWQHQVGLTKEGFARFHPSGLLGKSLSLKVKDLMVEASSCAKVDSTQTIQQALIEMTSYPVGLCAVVGDRDRLEGIIVEGDVRRYFQRSTQNAAEVSVAKILNPSPISVAPNELAITALRLMEDRTGPISVLPVLDDQKTFLGAIRLHDLLKGGFAPRA